MAKEIERKFLVKDDSFEQLANPLYFHQGYLSSDIERTVRVRVEGTKAVITIKGRNSGMTRDEYEYEIPLYDAYEMLGNLCIKPTIQKFRYEIEYMGHIWQVDKFEGFNKGLVVAEIELSSENESFEKPEWIGEEVTGNPLYYNSNLISNPFSNWGYENEVKENI
ncbi:MAG: CYTH domain-containing protein [Bacteroidales bacterium]|nr:CYTH domain-containing protein [Bacteroidales bacterium]